MSPANTQPHTPPSVSVHTSEIAATRPAESVCKHSSTIGVNTTRQMGTSKKSGSFVYARQHHTSNAPRSANSEKCASVLIAPCNRSYAAPVAVAIQELGANTRKIFCTATVTKLLCAPDSSPVCRELEKMNAIVAIQSAVKRMRRIHFLAPRFPFSFFQAVSFILSIIRKNEDKVNIFTGKAENFFTKFSWIFANFTLKTSIFPSPLHI